MVNKMGEKERNSYLQKDSMLIAETENHQKTSKYILSGRISALKKNKTRYDSIKLNYGVSWEVLSGKGHLSKSLDYREGTGRANPCQTSIRAEGPARSKAPRDV